MFFDNAAELVQALEGEFGEEAQQEALQFADETGLLAQWQEADDGAADDDYMQALQQEMARVEQAIGRQLSQGEIDAMLNTLSTEDLNQGTTPNFVEEFGQELASARSHEAGRMHLGAEAAQAAMNEQAPEGNSIPQPAFSPPEPAGGDYGEEE